MRDLGVTSDREIARRIGVSSTTVRLARIQRGIAPRPVGRPPKSRATVESALTAHGLREVFPWHSAAAATLILGLCLLALAVRGCA